MQALFTPVQSHKIHVQSCVICEAHAILEHPLDNAVMAMVTQLLLT